MSTNQIIRTGAYALLTSGPRIVLIRKARGPYTGMWGLPGGGIEFGETPETALRREIEEETGLVTIPHPVLVGDLTATESHPDMPDTEIHLLGFLFRVELDTEFEVRAEPDGSDSLGARWFSLNEVETLEISNFAGCGVDRWIAERKKK